ARGAEPQTSSSPPGRGTTVYKGNRRPDPPPKFWTNRCKAGQKHNQTQDRQETKSARTLSPSSPIPQFGARPSFWCCCSPPPMLLGSIHYIAINALELSRQFGGLKLLARLFMTAFAKLLPQIVVL